MPLFFFYLLWLLFLVACSLSLSLSLTSSQSVTNHAEKAQKSVCSLQFHFLSFFSLHRSTYASSFRARFVFLFWCLSPEVSTKENRQPKRERERYLSALLLSSTTPPLRRQLSLSPFPISIHNALPLVVYGGGDGGDCCLCECPSIWRQMSFAFSFTTSATSNSNTQKPLLTATTAYQQKYHHHHHHHQNQSHNQQVSILSLSSPLFSVCTAIA